MLAERSAVQPSGTCRLREVAAEFGAAMRMSDRSGTGAHGHCGIARHALLRDPRRLGGGPYRQRACHGDRRCRLHDRRRRRENPVRAARAATGRARVAEPVATAREGGRRDDRRRVRRGRLRQAQDDRAVRVFDLDDGMARLIADGPAPLIHAIYDRLTQMGRAVIAASASDDEVAADSAGVEECADAGDGQTVIVTGAALDADDDDDALPVDRRTLDQVRVDVLSDLLLAGAPAAHGDGDGLAAITGHVQITVPAMTLVGAGSVPATLPGSGPIDPETARRLTANAPSWTRVSTDPARGHPLVVERYRPSKKQRRCLAARDEHCRFPGRRMPVRRCDVDHTVDAAEGDRPAPRISHTSAGATTCSSPTPPGRCGSAAAEVLEWISPAGHGRHRLPSTLRFVPTGSRAGELVLAGEPPPF